MKITLTSVLVDDQAKALRFYTGILGFASKLDLPVGEIAASLWSASDPLCRPA